MEMVTIGSLWLPILLSAVFVWIASALVWTVMPHHKKDLSGLPNEDASRKVLGGQNLSPGQYFIPYAPNPDDMKDPLTKKKFEEGPVGILTVMQNGLPNMGKNLALTFIYYLVVSFFIAYIASRTLAPDVAYLTVFRLTGTVAWMAYGLGAIQDAIWFGRPWSTVAKGLGDALLYALLIAGTFGWLWP